MRKHFSTLLAAFALLCMGSFSFATEARVSIPAAYGVKAEAPRYSQTDSVQAEAVKATAAHACSEADRLCGMAPAATSADTLDGFARSYAQALAHFAPMTGSGVPVAGARTAGPAS